MGIIRKASLGVTLGTAAALGYVRLSTSIIAPIPLSDALYSSNTFKKYNLHRNPATNDICVKTIPLNRIRPELLQKEGDLALEFCRAVWKGWGYSIQRRYLHRKYFGADTSSQLWTPEQIAASNFEPGTIVTDHFEVVERTPTEITIRCGDSPRTQGPRASDGLFAIGATIDKDAQVARLTLKSCFFPSDRKVEGDKGPMPGWIENLHQWYSRILMVSAARSLMR
ncbi:uncharacterized protein TRIREDRAFT_124083 [Trichoderma reesei QM6a]|uniref:Predicted protein n=2 Tax=Hypocrea jecorina TaxID=51453 RepID=G0RWB4_HYPJQ|nr:uncharacterized protein TRIREDRAFT_124083 [Trichoderma reesei QM6a]EGR44522.1 predicted protein [Trichoderma reesei QM6a]ETR97386.1 hypothetical protein M419DRAFT_139297 [Trichoderma reesei RUT C-30]